MDNGILVRLVLTFKTPNERHGSYPRVNNAGASNTLAVEEIHSHRRVFSSMRYSLRLWLFVATTVVIQTKNKNREGHRTISWTQLYSTVILKLNKPVHYELHCTL